MPDRNLHSCIAAIAESKKMSFVYFKILKQACNIISILLKRFSAVPVTGMTVCLAILQRSLYNVEQAMEVFTK
jgi:hypothetical protein